LRDHPDFLYVFSIFSYHWHLHDPVATLIYNNRIFRGGIKTQLCGHLRTHGSAAPASPMARLVAGAVRSRWRASAMPRSRHTMALDEMDILKLLLLP
jgi:hypothetical protein